MLVITREYPQETHRICHLAEWPLPQWACSHPPLPAPAIASCGPHGPVREFLVFPQEHGGFLWNNHRKMAV